MKKKIVNNKTAKPTAAVEKKKMFEPIEEEISFKKKVKPTEKQLEALRKIRESGNAKRKSGEIISKRKTTTKKQKESSKKMMNKINKKKRIDGRLTEKKIVKAFLESESVTEAAKKVGVSINHASRVLIDVEKSGSLAEAMFKAGLTFERQAELHKEFIEYNKEKVVRMTGEGMNSREVEEMRDGRLAFIATQHAAKFTAVSADVMANKVDAAAISDDTALLAIKSLLMKLDVEKLKVVRESVDALLESSIVVV